MHLFSHHNVFYHCTLNITSTVEMNETRVLPASGFVVVEALHLSHIQSMKPDLTACLYSDILIPVPRVLCCQRLQLSHCKASCLGLTVLLHAMHKAPMLIGAE